MKVYNFETYISPMYLHRQEWISLEFPCLRRNDQRQISKSSLLSGYRITWCHFHPEASRCFKRWISSFGSGLSWMASVSIDLDHGSSLRNRHVGFGKSPTNNSLDKNVTIELAR